MLQVPRRGSLALRLAQPFISDISQHRPAMIKFATLASVFGVMFLIGGVLFLRAHAFNRRAKRVRARIVSRSPGTRLNRGPVRTWKFVVEVKDSKGVSRSVALAESIGESLVDSLVEPDGTIAVRYDPARPMLVRADSDHVTYMIAAYFCIPGLLFLLLCAYVWLTY
jgi:hypothetical protein